LDDRHCTYTAQQSGLLLKRILFLLYSDPEKPVYVVAKNAEQHESLVLATWSQQWPQLRIAFSFCTGALASRAIRGRPLDLQIVSRQTLSESRRDLAKGSVLDESNLLDEGHAPNEEWVEIATADMFAPDRQIRRTAWRIVPPAVADRGSFPAVFYFASLIDRCPPQSAKEFVRAIAAAPGDLRVSSSLIDVILGVSDLSPVSTTFSERELLKALATEDLPHLSARDLNLPARAKHLWKTDSSGALQLFAELISRDNTTTLGNEILSSLCQSIEIEDLDSIAKIRPDFLSVIIKQNPQLAAAPVVWRLDDKWQIEIFHALMSADIVDSSVLREIVSGILSARSELVPQHALRYRDRLVVPILEWLNVNEAEIWQAARPWLQFLRAATDSVVAWLRQHQASPLLLLFLATAIPADASAVNLLAPGTWQPMLGRVRTLSLQDRVPVSAFLFALGLRHCDEIAIEFFQCSFETIHEAAERSGLDYEYWRPIEIVAPALGWWREWDKCERMRAALVDRFIACNWQPSGLLDVVTRARTLEHVFGLSTSAKTRKTFLKRVATSGLDTTHPAEQRAVLEKYAVKRG
jgi:hypothetical protein